MKNKYGKQNHNQWHIPVIHATDNSTTYYLLCIPKFNDSCLTATWKTLLHKIAQEIAQEIILIKPFFKSLTRSIILLVRRMTFEI